MTCRGVRVLLALAACLWLASCAMPGNVVIITPEEEQAPEEVHVPSPLVDYPPVEPVEPPLPEPQSTTPAATAAAPAPAMPPAMAAPGPATSPGVGPGAGPGAAAAPAVPDTDRPAPSTFSSAPASVTAPPAPIPEPPPATTRAPVPTPQDLELLALLADLQRYGNLGADDVRREISTATNALARHRNDANRVRLAILYTLTRGNPQDDQRAVLLLENVVKGDGTNAGIKELAVVLHVQITSRQRAVRDEQQKADVALQKLEALRQMERSLIRDRVRSGGGGGGGSGGGSGGGGGGGGG